MSGPVARLIVGPPNTAHEIETAIKCVHRRAGHDAHDILAALGLAS